MAFIFEHTMNMDMISKTFNKMVVIRLSDIDFSGSRAQVSPVRANRLHHGADEHLVKTIRIGLGTIPRFISNKLFGNARLFSGLALEESSSKKGAMISTRHQRPKLKPLS